MRFDGTVFARCYFWTACASIALSKSKSRREHLHRSLMVVKPGPNLSAWKILRRHLTI